MSKIKNHRFYRPGTTEAKGTKISLKTHPYVNGVLFNTQDPITSFHTYLSLMHTMVVNYEYLLEIPGLKGIIHDSGQIAPEDIGKVKLFLEYLSQSPIEITIKEQLVNDELLSMVEAMYD